MQNRYKEKSEQGEGGGGGNTAPLKREPVKLRYLLVSQVNAIFHFFYKAHILKVLQACM